MKVEKELRMATGDGGNSYAANSRLPEKALIKTRPVLEKAIQDVYTSTLIPQSQGIMVVADLGCSSGPNALLVVSEVTSILRECIRREEETDDHDRRHGMVAVQFFLNDLPGNDFNLVFRSWGS